MVSTMLAALAALACTAAHASPRAGNETVELFLLPHTHADVGWLETPVGPRCRLRPSRSARTG